MPEITVTMADIENQKREWREQYRKNNPNAANWPDQEVESAVEREIKVSDHGTA
jgi:hypothetical protein